MDEEEWSKEQEANRKPGQKHPTPSPGFADRVFYESLYHQVPTSKMAKKWCVEYGLLEWSEAERICKELGIAIKVKRSPVKSSPKVKRVKRPSSKSNIVDEVVDTGLQNGSAYEGIGTTGF